MWLSPLAKAAGLILQWDYEPTPISGMGSMYEYFKKARVAFVSSPA